MKYYYMKTTDGRTVEIPETHLYSTKKTHPDWSVMEETTETRTEVIPETAPKSKPYTCPICGHECLTMKGLKTHKVRKH